MNFTRKGRTYKFPFFKNIGFAFKQSYECAPVEFLVFFIFEAVSIAITAFQPLLLSKLVGYIEKGQVQSHLELFLLCISGYIVILTIDFVRNVISNRYYNYTTVLKLDPYNAKKIYQKLSKIKYGYLYSKDFVDQYQLVRSAAINGMIINVPYRAAGILGSVVGVGIVMFTLGSLNVWVMLIALLPAACQFVLHYKNASKDYHMGKEQEKLSRQVLRYSELLQNGRSLREMKANKSDAYIFENWEKARKEEQKYEYKRNMSWDWVDLWSALLETFTLVGVIAFCVFELKRGNMGVAVFAGIFSAVSTVFSQMRLLSSALGYSRRDMLFCDAYRVFVTMQDVEVENSDAKPEKFESIEFEHVSFAYPNYVFNGNTTEIVEQPKEDAKMVLNDVSFCIKKGERVAIVGENGSGKTTITRLVAKLYEPVGGRILFNGKPLSQANLAGYRDNFSVINQEYAPYELPLDVSVAAGVDKELSERFVKQKLEQAGADDVLSQANEHQGLSTWLTREFDGVELSGGQKQKVAIARGLAPKAEVLMVDEPTSALDPLVEEKILSNILKLTEGRTAIVISHRLSLCTKMDRILYMENGKIVEDGSHEELMKKRGGKYKKLFATQSKWYKDKTEDSEIEN